MSQIVTKKNRSNLFKVAWVGSSFTTLFTAFLAAQNLASQIYNEYNYTGLGQACVLTIYCFQGVGSIFASHIKRSLSHRQGMVFGTIGYVAFVLMGAFTSACNKYSLDFALCHETPIYLLNIIISVLVGLGASIIWLTQSDYVNLCSDESTKGFYNGVFWSLMQMSQIIGSVLATFVLANTDQFTFYIILLAFGLFSIVMFAFTPRIPLQSREPDSILDRSEEAPKVRETLGVSLRKFWDALVCKKSSFLLIPKFLIGVVIAFYASYLSTIVDATLDPDAPVQYINERVGFVLIALALGEVSAGFTIGRLADKIHKIKLLHAIIVIPEVALIFSIVAYRTKIYPFALLAGYLWGYSDTALNSITGTIIGAYFNGTLEYFSIMRSLTGFGVVFGAGLSLAFKTAVITYSAIIIGSMFVLHGLFLYLWPNKLGSEDKESIKPLLLANDA